MRMYALIVVWSAALAAPAWLIWYSVHGLVRRYRRERAGWYW